MKELTTKQRTIYNYIVSFMRRNWFAPSLEEIAENFGIIKNATRKQVWAIEKKGYLKRVGRRAFRILK